MSSKEFDLEETLDALEGDIAEDEIEEAEAEDTEDTEWQRIVNLPADFGEWDFRKSNEICVNCLKASGGYGVDGSVCQWAKRLIPIDGWVAEPDHSDAGTGTESFKVYRCPEYQNDNDPVVMTQEDYLKNLVDEYVNVIRMERKLREREEEAIKAVRSADRRAKNALSIARKEVSEAWTKVKKEEHDLNVKYKKFVYFARYVSSRLEKVQAECGFDLTPERRGGRKKKSDAEDNEQT